jgi:hypothetical protein
MFGKYAENCKQQAITIAKECGFNIYEFKETTEGQVIIEDCQTKEQL